MSVSTPEQQQSALLLAGAADYAGQQAAAQAALLSSVLALWATVDLSNVIASWKSGVGEKIYVLVSMLQQLVAQEASAYVRQQLLQQGLTYTGPSVVPGNFAGIASDGRDLESLLAGAVVAVREAEREGLSDEVAAQRGENFLRLVISTQIADAGRAAEGVAITVAAPVDAATGKKAPPLGWIRVLNPPSCGRCVALAGKWFAWNTGFQRHPMCFPAGVEVSGPATLAATRRWYKGELVTIRTASGKNLPVTANHPILTDRGWIPANLLQPGDHLVRSLLGQGATPLVVPHERQVPAKIEDLAGPHGVATFRGVPTTPQDFHGDGGDGEVDVVLADRFLRRGFDASLFQPDAELALAFRVVAAALLSSNRPFDQPLRRVLHAAHRIVRGGDLEGALGVRHPGRSVYPGGRTAADLNVLLHQAAADDRAADLVGPSQGQFAFAGGVPSRDFSVRDGDLATRWDAPAEPFTIEGAAGYAGRGKDLRERLADQVALDRIVDVSRVEWSGHVYNLTSAEGWFSANGVIVSNCDCVQLPATLANSDGILTDPDLYFKSLTPAEQDKYFGKAQAQAIRDGGAIDRVVNAARTKDSVYTADDGKRYTYELSRKNGGYGNRSDGVRRPTPGQIYDDAHGDQQAAVEALRRFGYITGPAA